MNLARVAVLAGLFLAAATAIILQFVAPPSACPGWQLRGISHSLWVEFFYTAPFLAIACYIVLLWDRHLRRAIETDEQDLLPAHYVLTGICIFGAAVAQLPLMLVIGCVTSY